jgi:transforming growth factor-beta-induced protein
MKKLSLSMLALTVAIACSDDATPAGTSGGPSPDAGTGSSSGMSSGNPVTKKDIVDTAVDNGSFKILAELLTEAGLVQTLKGAGPFTVLAPTDAAFKKIPANVLADIRKDKKLLTKVLTYHVLAGNAPASEVLKLDKKAVAPLEGENLKIDIVGGKVILNQGPNQSTVETTDVLATNGVIHVIDTVLLPPTAVATKDIVQTAVDNGGFKTLATLLTNANLVETLKGDGPFTVFAPTDAAFDAVSSTLAGLNEAQKKDILLYHVAPTMAGSAKVVSSTTLDTALVGKKVPVAGAKLNGTANITMTDIACKNGIIHVIDAVMVPAP